MFSLMYRDVYYCILGWMRWMQSLLSLDLTFFFAVASSSSRFLFLFTFFISRSTYREMRVEERGAERAAEHGRSKQKAKVEGIETNIFRRSHGNSVRSRLSLLFIIFRRAVLTIHWCVSRELSPSSLPLPFWQPLVCPAQICIRTATERVMALRDVAGRKCSPYAQIYIIRSNLTHITLSQDLLTKLLDGIVEVSSPSNEKTIGTLFISLLRFSSTRSLSLFFIISTFFHFIFLHFATIHLALRALFLSIARFASTVHLHFSVKRLSFFFTSVMSLCRQSFGGEEEACHPCAHLFCFYILL